MNPFDIEKEVSQKLKGKPSDISSSGRNALLITVKDSSQSQLNVVVTAANHTQRRIANVQKTYFNQTFLK